MVDIRQNGVYIYNNWSNKLYLDIILFVVLAAVLATNLYRLLGKKNFSKETNTRSEKNTSTKDALFSHDVHVFSKNQILRLDRSFNFQDFLVGAKEAFQLIVMAYKNKKIEEVRALLSKEVFDNFYNSIEKAEVKNKKTGKLSIKNIRASILNIEIIKKLARIKVEFLSDQEDTETNGLNIKNNIKDIWVFQKDMTNNSPIWQLVEVSAE